MFMCTCLVIQTTQTHTTTMVSSPMMPPQTAATMVTIGISPPDCSASGVVVSLSVDSDSV